MVLVFAMMEERIDGGTLVPARRPPRGVAFSHTPKSPLGVKMILYCCSDLLWATKVKSTADALGIPCRPARNLEMLAARLSDSPVRALIVDLESGPTAIELIQAVRQNPPSQPPIRVVAFAPHVEVDAMRSAASAGADSTMTRGAFNSRLPEILKDLARAV